jgi:hypothetical protein
VGFLGSEGGYLLRGDLYCDLILVLSFRPVNPYHHVVSPAMIRIFDVQLESVPHSWGMKIRTQRGFAPLHAPWQHACRGALRCALGNAPFVIPAQAGIQKRVVSAGSET